MKYQPNQELSDYETSDLVTSSVITGDFTTDSLKYGFGPTSGNAAESEPRYGVAVLEHDPMSSTHPKVSGTVHFEDTGEGLKIDYEIRGLYNGLHGFHIHEYGDLTDGCTSACAHFNPDNETHGGLDTETRHMGDLGNISSENRVSKGSLFLPQAKLDSSKYGVLGRMVIVHADEDDLGQGGDEESLKTGNAGKRLACGVIGLAEPPQKLEAEDDYDATYGQAQAKIRRRLKKKIMAQAIMGTKAGEWSARKSQELKRQYEAACEKAGLKPYKGSKTKSQDNLSKWSKQNWRTASGKKSSKTGEPYFPAKAVAELKQKNLYSKAIRQKKAATQAGKQHARYSDDIRAVVKKYRSEEVFAVEPWDSGERFSISPRDLEREIADGLHTNSSGDLGCPACGNIDYFWKTTTAKGTKYRCMMCEYTDDYETVKSQGDITLEKFGLTVECPICEESISAYNQDSINRHLRKHEKEASESLEAEDSETDDYALVVGDLSDTEQLSLEIEDIDETYGLLNLSEIETSVQEFAVNAASEMMDDYSDIMPCVAIVFVSDSFSAHHVARYRGQTVGNCPIVMLSLSAIKDSAAEYDVPLNLAVATSVWHELGHALDEYCLDYLNFDVVFETDDDPEEFAESFARWYSGFSHLAPPTQEQLFELSEE